MRLRASPQIVRDYQELSVNRRGDEPARRTSLDLLSDATASRECRIYFHGLALRLEVPMKGAGLADGIEVFPKHDVIGSGDFGNAIRGPLGIHRGDNPTVNNDDALLVRDGGIASVEKVSARGREAPLLQKAEMMTSPVHSTAA
jgi:hypothetical protein